VFQEFHDHGCNGAAPSIGKVIRIQEQVGGHAGVTPAILFHGWQEIQQRDTSRFRKSLQDLLWSGRPVLIGKLEGIGKGDQQNREVLVLENLGRLTRS